MLERAIIQEAQGEAQQIVESAQTQAQIIKSSSVSTKVVDLLDLDTRYESFVGSPEEGFSLEVDLQAQCVRLPDGEILPFTVEAYRRQCLLEGLDDIGVSLKSADAIRAYEARTAGLRPWLFPEVAGQ